MKHFLFYTICLCFFYIKFGAAEERPNTIKYLDRKSEEVKNDFEEKLKTLIEDYDIEEEAISPINSSDLSIFPLLNETLIFFDYELHRLSYDQGNINITKITEFSRKNFIKFIRVTQFEGLAFIAVVTKTEIDIYGFHHLDHIFYVHSILAPYAADAHFFINKNSLNLLVLANKVGEFAQGTLYQWQGSVFHKKQKVIASGAIKIKSFRDHFFEIIIVLQYLPSQEVLSSVYQYGFGRLKKIQHIKTTAPVHHEVYQTMEGTYLIIFEKSKNNLLYSWDGSKFVKMSQFKTQAIVNTSVTVATNNTSFIAVPLEDKIQVYRLLSRNMELISERKISNYSTILDIQNVNHRIYIVGLNENAASYISSITFKTNFTNIGHETRNEALQDCFHTLEMNMYKKKRMLKGARQILSQEQISNISNIHEMKNNSNIGKSLNKMKVRLVHLQQRLKDFQQRQANKSVLYNKVIIRGSIEADKLVGKNVNITKLNDQDWVPQQWLNYKQPQNLSGIVTANKIIIADLYTSKSDPTFTDLLTKNGDQSIRGKLQVKNLTAIKVNTEKINNIELKDIYLKSDLEGTKIQGLKTFENLTTSKAEIKLLNKQPIELSMFSTDSPASHAMFDEQLEVENLLVDNINDFNWHNFTKTVFRIGITKEINGNLTFSEFKTNNMTLKTLKNVNIEDLFTISTDQVINADMKFIKISAENITTSTTNGIQFSKSAVQMENDTLIEGPVKFDKLYVRGNLKLVGKLDEDFFLTNGEHIVGTNESDLLQNYDGIIKIKGNLYVKNITLKPEAKLIVAEEEFDTNISNVYWTKNTKQIIPSQFKAYKGMTVPHLFTKKINDVNFTQYMLNKDEDRLETSYYFENVSILGNVLLNSSTNHTPNIAKLEKEAVKTTGSYHIDGTKIYKDALQAEHLGVNMIDGIEINDNLTRKSKMNIIGEKAFKNITIKGNLSCNLNSVDFINGINITNLVENAIYIDEPTNIEKLHFKNISTKDLWVTEMNNNNVNQHIQNLEKVLASRKVNSLILEGSAKLEQITGVTKINNIEFNDLLNNTWNRGIYGSTLLNLEFLDHVNINDLITAHINDINLKNLTKRLLYRGRKQNITANYSFKNIKTENLILSKVNEISMEDLIDISNTTSQTIHAPNGIIFNSVILQKYIQVNETSPCDLIGTLRRYKSPPTRKWKDITVKGNITFLDPNNILFRLFEKTVTMNSRNVIEAPVQFTKHVWAQNIRTKRYINDVNINEIINDAVLMDSEEEQVITGLKIFSTIYISNATVVENADVPVVNLMDIPELNKFIVRKNKDQNYVIKGNKTFSGGLQCDNFYSERLSNIDVNNIVSTKKVKKIPLAILDSIEVKNNLNISSINKFNFEVFMKTRILTEGPETQRVNGIYYFDNIKVQNMKTTSINQIETENIVFDEGQQNISSPKVFMQPVNIFGNLTCSHINGIDLSEIYNKSVRKEDDSISGSMTMLRPSFVNKTITTEYINGYPVELIKETLNQETIKSETQKIHHIKKDIVDTIKRNINYIKFLANDYMYIEKSQALQISVPNTLSAEIMETKGYVLIHVNGEESGEKCGLHKTCRCPVQYSIEISPKHSVTVFPNKGSQRIFTYNDDNMIVHFLTNSFSTNSACRSGNSRVMNEVSMMTWNTFTSANSTGRFYQYDSYITGYISGAEFFTLSGHAYAVIGRYYDPTTNNHDLDCYLIKFNQDKSKAEIIQKIDTIGAWSIYLFHTAQGVILIIGNIKTLEAHHIKEETQIYRFNESTQKFVLLRIIPSYGCSMATGVVLSIDSLIVLAHRHLPPRILKYNPNYDNYYFYQCFELEAPVIGISVFYTGGFGISDAYLCTVTSNEQYFIYSFRFIEGWKLESSGELEGLRNLIPFQLNQQLYLFAPSSKISSLLTIVRHSSD